jgi:hypothetical protein
MNNILIYILINQLEFCKKNEAFEEKIHILENLVNYTNEKSQSAVSNIVEILNEYTNLCVLVRNIIYNNFLGGNIFRLRSRKLFQNSKFFFKFSKNNFNSINKLLHRPRKEQLRKYSVKISILGSKINEQKYHNEWRRHTKSSDFK